MAPAGMFAYLRSHHKRSNSTPTSPAVPDASTASHTTSLPPQDFFSYNRIAETDGKSQTPVSSLPPVLPPIPRVASQHDSSSEALRVEDADAQEIRLKGPAEPSQLGRVDKLPGTAYVGEENARGSRKRPQTAQPTGYRSRAQGFAVGEGRDRQDGRLESSTSGGRVVDHEAQSQPAVLMTTIPAPQQFRNASKLEKSSVPDTYGVHMVPQRAPSSHPVKSGKTKRNLLNPMSLLMRRRSGQALEHLSEESLVSHRNHFKPGMALPDDYDPRIRGKGVHDFSAPRSRRDYSHNNVETAQAGSIRTSYAKSSTVEEQDGLRNATVESPSKPDRAHTPIFTEHFDDSINPHNTEQAVQAEALANPNFLARVSLPPAERDMPLIPPPMRNSDPFQASRHTDNRPLEAEVEAKGVTELATVPEVTSPASPTSPTTSTPQAKQSNSLHTAKKARSRVTSGVEFSSPSNLPARFASRSSRFSFQLSSVDSAAQEKVLEERHKQKAAAKASSGSAPSAAHDDDDYIDEDDMYDYDDMDADDGFEEPVPLSQDYDLEDEADGQSGAQQTIDGFDFSTAQIGLSSNSLDLEDFHSLTLGTPKDVAGNKIGFAVSDVMQSTPLTDTKAPGLQGLDGTEVVTERASAGVIEYPGPSVYNTEASSIDDDDLYFDDGLVEDPTSSDGQPFDESAFDDPSNPLYERQVPKLNALQKPHPDSLPSSSPEKYTSGDEVDSIVPQDSQSTDTEYPPLMNPFSYQATKDPEPGFDNLAAYHDALAQAATKAAADGRFLRQDSVDARGVDGNEHGDQQEEPPALSSRPSLIPDDSRISQETASFTSTGFGTGAPDDYGYDDDSDSVLEDDPIIAAANAEALANDDDGFYGHEFGFYASAHGSAEAEFANGGFFGPRGIDAIGRSRSFREPNLTPVTERSEYSARNSYISLHSAIGLPVGAGGALPSPGLAQLARMSPYGFDDDEMSLSQLMKLRRGAFGGSNGSLRSAANSSPSHSSQMAFSYSSSSKTGLGGRDSPLAGPGVTAPSAAGDVNGGHTAPYDEQDSEDDEDLVDEANAAVQHEREGSSSSSSARDSPTLTAADYPATLLPDMMPSLPPPSQGVKRPPSITTTNNFSKPLPPPAISLSTAPTTSTTITNPPMIFTAPAAPALASSSSTQNTPVSPSRSAQPWRTHSRNGSGADSVTYVKEKDGWVLERRRTAESGELELVGREVVLGGRI